MSRVLVTGSSGLLGGYVVAALAGEAEVEAGTEVTGLDARPPPEATAARLVRHVEGSILDLDGLTAAAQGMDAIVHVAAAANIHAGPPERILELNAMGTWRVLEAARLAGVRRVVLCSTDSVMGNTVWQDHLWLPERLPVDEDHPLAPADPYGLSKLMAEQAGRAYARRGLRVIALRPVFILFPSMMGEVRARHADPAGYRGPCAGGHAPAGGGFLWHHVDPRDVAEAVRLALRSEIAGFEAFYLSAPSTLHPLPTLDRIAEIFGRLPADVDRERFAQTPFAPLFDTRRAEARLGWRARHDHRRLVHAAS